MLATEFISMNSLMRCGGNIELIPFVSMYLPSFWVNYDANYFLYKIFLSELTLDKMAAYKAGEMHHFLYPCMRTPDEEKGLYWSRHE